MSQETKHYLSNLWRWKCGLEEIDFSKVENISLEDLRKSEWSNEFEELMRNRLLLGALRYGKMGHGSIPEGKPKYDRCDSIRKRLKFFEETGNAEWLVDIANMSLLMFEERVHENFHFSASDDTFHDKIIK